MKVIFLKPNAIEIHALIENGDLPFLLFYQSLNGHPEFETHGTIEATQERYNTLKALGRSPQVYLHIQGTFQ